jgi:uncharacterized membrane protein
VITRLRRTHRDDRGAVLILGALFAGVAVIAAALAVDIGALVVQKRSNQRVADMASLDAVRGLASPATGLTQRGTAETLALASAKRNGFDMTSAVRVCSVLTPDPGATYTLGAQWMRVDIGKYDPSKPDNFSPISCPAAGVLETLFPTQADAVRVIVSSPVAFRFMHGGGRETATAVAKLGSATPSTTTSSTSTTLSTTTTSIVTTVGPENAGARVGSRMASINTTQAAVLNAILTAANNPQGGLLGNPPGALAVSAAGYQGLGNVSMSMEELATQLGISAGTVDQVLTAEFSYSDLLNAMAVIADNKNQDQVAATIRDIATYTVPLDYAARHQTISLDDFTGMAGVTGGAQTFNGSSVSEGSLNVLELVRGGAVLADSDHLVSVPLSATTAGLLPTGVTGATANVSVIEAAQYKYGPVPTSAQTAQLSTSLVLTVPINIAGVGSITANVPVGITGGGATATAQSLACNADHTAATSELMTAQARTLTGQTGAWSASVSTLLGNLVSISAAPGSIVPTSGTTGTATFAPAFNSVASITPAHLGDLSMSTSMISVSGVLPIGTTVSSVAGTIVNNLNPILANLNATVMGPLYDALGIGFASADYSPTQPDGKTIPECQAGTTTVVTSPPTTTTTTAPATTVPPSSTYSGYPVLVD